MVLTATLETLRLLAYNNPGMAAAETITVLFTDLVGSTAAAERAGHTAYERYRHQHFAAMREAIATHNGTEVKTVGDAFMAVFTGAGDAIACGVVMQQAQTRLNRRGIAPGLRVGISAGDVTKEGGDYFGLPVVEASRLCASAGGGQVLVSDIVRLLDRSGRHRFEPCGSFELKGISSPVAASEVVYEAEADDFVSGRTPFVGRRAERILLSRLIDRALGGHGALVMIGGEPGVGKTRLAEEAMIEARAAGMFTAVGHCYEMEGAPPYIPFVEAIEYAMRVVPTDNLAQALGESASEVARLVPDVRRVFPDTPPPIVLPAEQGRRYLLNSVRDYLGRAAGMQPMLLVIDDLHWADDSTLLLLDHVAQRLEEVPLLVIGTYRDVELDVARPLARTLEGLNRRGLVERISLRRLPRDDVMAMLLALSHQEPPESLVEVVYGETEGVPFFVQEVYRYLLEEGRLFDAGGAWRSDVRLGEVEVPESVRLVIGRRLERVAEGTRRVLTAASIIGRAFTFELLRGLVDASEDELLDALDEAERAHLIATGAGRDTRINFAHEQIRQTLLSGMSLPRRQRMHLRVAEALERAYESDLAGHASDLAHHLYQAGAAADPGKTAHYLTLAGDQAMSATAFEDALRLLQEALSIVPVEEARERARLHARIAVAAEVVRGIDDALANWEKAFQLFCEEAAADDAAGACTEASRALLWAERFAEQHTWVQRGLALEGVGELAAATLLSNRANGLMWTATPELADSLMEHCETVAAAEDPAVLPLLDNVLGWAFHTYQLDRAVAHCSRAIRIATRTRDQWMLADALFFGGLATGWRGDMRRGHAMLNDAEPAAALAGNRSASSMLSVFARFWAAILDGDAAAAFDKARSPAGAADGIGWNVITHAISGYLALLAGRVPEAEESFLKAYEVDIPGRDDGVGWMGLLLLYAYQGRAQDVDRLLAMQRVPVPVVGQLNGIGNISSLLEMAQVAVLMDLPVDWAAWHELQEQIRPPEAVVYPGECGLWDCAAGIMAGRAGRWQSAIAHFEAAMEQAQQIPHRPGQADTRRWYGDMLLRRDDAGDRDRARALLTEAIDLYRSIGMPLQLAHAERLLAS